MPSGLNVGCCGFPVGRSRYFPEFDAVEITSTATRIPKIETAERWRSEAPPGFKFSIRVPRILTASSPFRITPALRKTLASFRAVLEALEPHFVVYETPAVFYPSADNMRAMYDFFKGPGRGPWRSVWIPRGRQFDEKIRTRICTDLRILLGADALNAEDPPSGTRYWRLTGRAEGGHRVSRGVSFTDAELRTAMSRCASGKNSYVFLENAAMFRDAKRLKKYSITGQF
ncbi:MAG: hypothetical protein COB53_10215 [Elusimicrobia bacterium]|nr:MAG: hypothetical protein COB53_10215 [Elusimicrobiota bacterium]